MIITILDIPEFIQSTYPRQISEKDILSFFLDILTHLSNLSRRHIQLYIQQFYSCMHPWKISMCNIQIVILRFPWASRYLARWDHLDRQQQHFDAAIRWSLACKNAWTSAWVGALKGVPHWINEPSFPYGPLPMNSCVQKIRKGLSSGVSMIYTIPKYSNISLMNIRFGYPVTLKIYYQLNQKWTNSKCRKQI